MKLYILYFFIVLNMPGFFQSPSDNSALPAINMKIVKEQYPYLFADYHPAKFAYPDPSFIYYYKYQNTTGEFHRIGLMRILEKDGYEYIGDREN